MSGTNGKANRRADGRFLPGHSLPGPGNPHVKDVSRWRKRWMELVREGDIDAAYAFIIGVFTGAPEHKDASYSIRLKAAQEFLDRTIGKPDQTVEIQGGLGEVRERLIDFLTKGAKR